MTTLLVRNATLLVTMDDRRREISDGGLFIRDGFIEQVGSSADLPASADEVLDLRGHLILPGFINTHHHFYQTLTRAGRERDHSLAIFVASSNPLDQYVVQTPDFISSRRFGTPSINPLS